MFTFKAFRAVDEPEICDMFIEGHANVLKDYGVTKVTSSNNDWKFNPYVFVVTVHEDSTGKVVSGLRIHIAHEDFPLPMEGAIAPVDSKIFELVKGYRINGGTGEIGGLWNSRLISGYGIGAIFLSRTSLVIAEQLNVPSLFALCAEYTLKPTLQKGFEIEENIGNKGTFFYPKLDLVATLAVLKDVKNLPVALPVERDFILELRENLDCSRMENTLKGPVEITYQLKIKNPDWRKNA
ncbi:hypothetical protein SAMN04487988_10528 [Algoriphagus hitonicola]|uniref:N-acetyltransferase domain-containing protein n=1 Tax=Algoriphagus hitonicola TaxID=435880 RepID=A0A1I2SS03_9BACT|nr:hypothetical protein [Algoriphagus hitonicola]SFG55343.1 hypothetical protein SAMN04487988_10528 [Algoriphagus hitonicola]